MSYQSLLGVLLPPVSYSPDQTLLSAELYAEGNALESATTAADRVKNAVTPLYAEALLPDWERVLAITPASGATYQARLNAVLSKLNEVGELSIPYFISLAASIGYTISIDEPQPFRAGTSHAGDTVYIPDVVFIWLTTVTGSSTPVYRFRSGSSVPEERFTSFSDAVIDSVFNDLKPAHSFVYFAYET